MKERQDYIQDLAEIRSMMERSSKFLSLSGWAGVMAGVYALAGAFIAYRVLGFNPQSVTDPSALSVNLGSVLLLATAILVLAFGTAVLLSYRNAAKRKEALWNATARRMLLDMAIPLVAGGLLALVFIARDLVGLVAPTTLIFYGLALYNAGRSTYAEVKTLGLIQIALGLVGAYLVNLGLLCWALGFGVVHIIYGIYIHNRYEQ